MTFLLLLSAAVLAATCAYTITAAETAFTYLPHQEAQELAFKRPHTRLARVLEHATGGESERYTHPLRLARILSTTIASLTTMLAILELIDQHSVAAVLTLGVVSLAGYPLLSVGARATGRNRSVAVLKMLAAPTYYTALLLGPITRALDVLVRVFSPRRTPAAPEGVFAQEELREFLDRASEAETIEGDEAQIVQSVFEMDDTRIRSIMVPRTDMLTIEANETLKNATTLFLRSGYSRMPVIGESTDDILGILYLKDAVRARLATADSAHGGEEPTIVSLMRPAHFEPESKPALDLLRRMQRESTHVAIVVDEYGGTAGMITLEDIIEELVGDISDEYDNEKPDYALQEDGSFKVSARLGVEQLGEIFGINLEDEEVDTVGGLLAKNLGKVPIVGAEVTVNGIHIRAVSAGGRRHQIDTLLVWAQPPHEPEQNHSHEETDD